MKILLIGNKGQVGAEIFDLALTKKYQIVGYDIDTLDIVDNDQVSAIVKKHLDVDVVINAAAYTTVDKAEEEVELAYAVNRDGVANLAQTCCKYGLPLLHISTDYVFSGESERAYSEEDAANPLSVYGGSKLAGDQILQQTWAKHIILRVSGVFGKYGNNFVKTILRLAEDRETLNIVDDQFCCPTAAADIARVLLIIAEHVVQGKAKWGIYNYCNSPVTTWYGFAQKIIELGGKKHQLKLKNLNKITTEQYPVKAKRPRNSALKVEKICRDYEVKRREWLPYLEEMIG
jgi:dTDP-4-dehydrorhamnose reductase